MKTIYQILLAIFSSILLTLSFPNANLEFLAFLGLVPLMIAVFYSRSIKNALFISYISGVLFFGLTCYWIYKVTPLLYFVFFYGGLYFLVFGYVLKKIFLLPDKNELLSLVVVSAFWVGLEITRNYVLTGISWALLGYSQYLTLPIIQIADIGGVYMVSGLVVMVNYLIFILVKNRFIDKKRSWAHLKSAYIFTGIVLIIVLGYGFFRLWEKPEGPKVRLSVIQGNIPLNWYWSNTPETRKLILDKHIILTKEASRDNPELIVWPETSVPGFLEDDKDIHEAVKDLSNELSMPLLIGSPTITFGDYFEKIYNSVILQSKGQVLDKYSKQHLVPFGEYIPLETNLYFIRELIPNPVGEYSPGTKYTIFNLKEGIDFGVTICFEDIFPELVNGFVRNGADFIINITNDAWFGDTSAPYQHAQASVFRAVENRVNVVRAANTGLSCFIDPRGAIFAKVENSLGKEIFIEGYKTAEITISREWSFYRSFGDIYALLCAIFSIFSFFWLFKPNKQLNLNRTS